MCLRVCLTNGDVFGNIKLTPVYFGDVFGSAVGFGDMLGSAFVIGDVYGLLTNRLLSLKH